MKQPYLTSIVFGLAALLPASAAEPEKSDKPPEDIVVLDKFVTSEKPVDPTGLINNRPINSAFGFDKPLVEAPKAISLISTLQMETVGIRVSDDLVKVAPSTYSNFRYGLQGNISIRNQTSDFYFRGMKRIDPQGNFRTMWGANDGLEIVRGPASPIFGLGRIGGYVNFIPKTARASTGKYLDHDSGSIRMTVGAYDKKIAALDVAGPIPIKNHPAGYAVYAYWEDSGSYFQNSFDKQQLIQTTFTVDLTHALRIETGVVYHHSNGGLPGGTNRTTHDQIATDTYWSGQFSYQLDENHDGSISEREIRNSYFWGSPQFSAKTTDPLRKTTGIGPSLYFFGTQNDPFNRRLPWQGGPINGGTITMAQFKTGYADTQAAALGFVDPATGGPRQRMGYQLMVYPTISDGNTKGAPGQVPNKAAPKQAFWLPPAFDLNPDTWVQKPWNEKMGFGEDYYKANIGTFFFDMINDSDPNMTIKNQILVDGHHQIKDGRNPFSQWQAVTSFEDKVTYTRKFQPKSWWQLDTLASINTYAVWSYRAASNPTDYDMRRDLQFNNSGNVEGTFTPNDRFYSLIAKSDYDGSPVSAYNKSRTSVSGLGLLFDQTFFDRLNVLTGYRYDYIDAIAYLPANSFYERGGSTAPATLWVGGPAYPYAGTGLFVPDAYQGKGNSGGPSMMANIGIKLPWGLRPYFQAGKQTVLVNNASDQSVNVGTIRNSLVGKSQIVEGGLKASEFKDKLFMGLAYYEQSRISFDPISTVGGAVNSTITRGFEYEIRWVATKHLSVATTGTWSYAHYQQGGVISIDGRSAGYPDVVDATGKVVIPAEAFAWGGRFQTAIPDSDPRYRKVEAIPATVTNLTATYTLDNGMFAQTTVLHQGPQFVDRLQTLKIPEGTTFDLSFGIRKKKWEIYANVVNAGNKKLYTKGVTEILISPKFARNFDITFTKKF
jgi:iron complex outermembrane recepter protein